MAHTVSTTRSPDLLRQVGIVVLPGFSLLAHACATEPLHVANLLHGRTLYRLTSYASGGDAVTSASQQTVLPRAALGEVDSHPDMVLVCGPAKLPGGIPDDLAAWLRRLAASGVVLGGIGGGTEALARLACWMAIRPRCPGSDSKPLPLPIPGCACHSSYSRSTAIGSPAAAVPPPWT